MKSDTRLRLHYDRSIENLCNDFLPINCHDGLANSNFDYDNCLPKFLINDLEEEDLNHSQSNLSYLINDFEKESNSEQINKEMFNKPNNHNLSKMSFNNNEKFSNKEMITPSKNRFYSSENVLKGYSSGFKVVSNKSNNNINMDYQHMMNVTPNFNINSNDLEKGNFINGNLNNSEFLENKYIFNKGIQCNYNNLQTNNQSKFLHGLVGNSNISKFSNNMNNNYQINQFKIGPEAHYNDMNFNYLNVHSYINTNNINNNFYNNCLVNDHSKNDKVENPKRILSSEDVIISLKNQNVKKETFTNMIVPKKLHSTKVVKGIKSKNSDKNCKEEFETYEGLIQTLKSLKIDLTSFVCTEKGSRAVQKILDKICHEKLDLIIDMLKNGFSKLMTDIYGNYLCQKLILSCSTERRIFILKNISSNLTEIACNSSGTHSVQSLIEIIKMKEEEEIIKQSVNNNFMKLCLDSNGTHVVQKILSHLNESSREIINYSIIENVCKLVFDSNGICVIKKFIKANKDLQLRKSFIDSIKPNVLEIVQNPFGNYVIQYIFEEWGVDYCKDIYSIIINNIISLSMQKFSSNVVEKCVDLSNEKSRKLILKEMFNAHKISSLIKNKYGNFVLQKSISVLTPEQKKEIKEELIKKVSYTASNKEKNRLVDLIESL